MAGVFLCALTVMACTPPEAPTPPVVDRLGLSGLSGRVDAGDFGKIASILVSQRGEILFEDYFGGTGPEGFVDMRSAGKSLTALAVGAAIDDGLIDGVEAPVFPAFRDRAPFEQDGAAKAAIVLGDLLSMSAALDCNDWDPQSPGNEARMYRTRDWTRFVLDLPTIPEAGGPKRFRYCTAGVFLVGQMLERSVGQRFDRYVGDRIFAPLGIEGAVWRRSPSGEVQSGGQLGLRARAAERIGRLVLNRGLWEGERVVSAAWIAQMLTPRFSPQPGLRYGYLWWLAGLSDAHSGQTVEAAMMLGNGGNLVAVVPALDAVIVIQAQNYNRAGHTEISRAIVRSFVLPALLRDRGRGG